MIIIKGIALSGLPRGLGDEGNYYPPGGAKLPDLRFL
jgi:hypothetical protein